MTTKAREDIALMLEGAGYQNAANEIRRGLSARDATFYIAGDPLLHTHSPRTRSLSDMRVMLAVELLHHFPRAR